MTELFMKLLNMSINAGWLVLTVLLVHIIFRKAPKWLFPVLWSFVGIRLLMPNALESRLSVIPDISGFSASEQGLLSAKGFTAPVPYVGIVWCTGMAVMLLFEALSYVHLRSKVKTAVRLSSNVYQSEHVNAPFILGLFAPRIYIPVSYTHLDVYKRQRTPCSAAPTAVRNSTVRRRQRAAAGRVPAKTAARSLSQQGQT